MNDLVPPLPLLQPLQTATFLPPYPTSQWPAILYNLKNLQLTCEHVYDQGLSQDGELQDEFKPVLALHVGAVERNKRVLLAYHAFRLRKLLGLRGQVLDDDIKATLSEEEVKFDAKVKAMRARYADAEDCELTLPGYALRPPNSLRAEYVVREDAGTVLAEEGRVRLGEGSRHFLVRGGGVDGLVDAGAVEER